MSDRVTYRLGGGGRPLGALAVVRVEHGLAQLLGASRQRVNQELKGFEREGAVRVEPARLVVLSREKLLAIAER